MSRFVKGDSRINRAGRPRKGEALTDVLARGLRRPDREALVKELVRLALCAESESTRLAAIKYIFDRLDGSPRQAVDVDAALFMPTRIELVCSDMPADAS
jgi:hypothetical protein